MTQATAIEKRDERERERELREQLRNDAAEALRPIHEQDRRDIEEALRRGEPLSEDIQLRYGGTRKATEMLRRADRSQELRLRTQERRVIESDHTPAGWQPANLVNRRANDEIHSRRVKSSATSSTSETLKPNLNRSNKKRKRTVEPIASLHTKRSQILLSDLESSIFGTPKTVRCP